MTLPPPAARVANISWTPGWRNIHDAFASPNHPRQPIKMAKSHNCQNSPYMYLNFLPNNTKTAGVWKRSFKSLSYICSWRPSWMVAMNICSLNFYLVEYFITRNDPFQIMLHIHLKVNWSCGFRDYYMVLLYVVMAAILEPCSQTFCKSERACPQRRSKPNSYILH